MAFPKLSTSREDIINTKVLQAYTNPDFLAEQILPVLQVTEESGKLAGLGNEHLRVYTSKRSLNDEGQHRMEFTYTSDDSYAIDYYDLEIYAAQRLQDQVQAPFDVRRDAGIVLRQALMLEREVALATALASTSIVSNNTTLSGTAQWNDFNNSDPAAVIETGRDSVQSKIGKEANSMIIQRGVLNKLKYHPLITNYFKGIATISQSMVISAIKELFELENVYVAKPIYISSKEGQTETKASVWGKHVVLFYKPSSPSLFEPSFGYQIKKIGTDMRLSYRRSENDTGDMIKLETAYQDKILDANCAYLIKNAIA